MTAVSTVGKDNRGSIRGPCSQGTWEAQPRWKIEDCPLFGLKRIQRKKRDENWGIREGDREAVQPRARPWWRGKGTFLPRGRGLDGVIILPKLVLYIFITHWVYLPKGKLRGSFSGHFITPDPVLPSPSLNLVKSVSRTLVQSEDWRPSHAGVSHGIFPGESWITTDKILNNGCNSAGCWHCSCASAELKHSEV